MNQQKTILIVDDEPIIIQSLKIQLEQLLSDNHNIEYALSGEEAFELLFEFHSNNKNVFLIISDYNLDDMKGTEILAQAIKLFPDVKKVIFSGQLEDEGIDEFDRLHKLDLKLGKPWNVYLLTELINKNV